MTGKDILLSFADDRLTTYGETGITGHHPVDVYLASNKPTTRRTYKAGLDRIAQLVTNDPDADGYSINWHELRYEHTRIIRTLLEETHSPSTANNRLSALRGILKTCWRMGLMSDGDYHKAVDIRRIKGNRVPKGRQITSGEIEAIIITCESTESGIRDASILSLLYGCGLRRAEIVALDYSDYDKTNGRLIIKGKGNKERTLYPTNGTARFLSDWLSIRGEEAGALFLGLGNRNNGSRITTQAIYKMIQTRAEKAGIENLSPHDFRRTFISDLLDRGTDLVTVQKLAGHENITTTAQYDRRGEEAKKKAMETLHVPYRKISLLSSNEE